MRFIQVIKDSAVLQKNHSLDMARTAPKTEQWLFQGHLTITACIRVKMLGQPALWGRLK